MSEAYIKLARILRTRPEVLLDLEEKLNKLTSKTGVIEKIIQENEMLIGRTLVEFGLDRQVCDARKIYDVLIGRLVHMDESLYRFLGKPDLAAMSEICGQLCDVAMKAADPGVGFFIKKEKAARLLEKFPPQNLLDHFNYKTAEELIEKQGFESVFSALRFAQDEKWMHEFFEKAYDGLTAEDFEEREVELKVLEPQWLDVAEKFLKKKYHNVSHLKELGIIFIIPLKIDPPGETLRLFTLMLHYLNEVPFYSKLFRKFSGERDFTKKLKSLLRGDVPLTQLPINNYQLPTTKIRIVQRYLAKDDANDFRLAEPHFNPEAEHWYSAEGDLGKVSSLMGAEGNLFGYWQGLDFVGDFFPSYAKASEGKHDDLISFDLIDLVMSLVKKGEIKYLYHQQEALWNKIFIEYLGRDRMNELVEENIISGFIKL